MAHAAFKIIFNAKLSAWNIDFIGVPQSAGDASSMCRSATFDV